MSHTLRLNRKKRYLQIALNSTIEEAARILALLPQSDRLIIEVGTPLIKRYGSEAIRMVRQWWASRFDHPYIVADMKTMDRGETEVAIAASAGADAVVALGHAPTETLAAFIAACEQSGVDAFIDMMNVPYPLSVLRALPQPPAVVLLHRGVDEERFNKEKQLPLYEIRRVKSNYSILIGVAGGDTFEEARRAAFNDADIVVVWKSFYTSSEATAALAAQFLKEIK